MSEERPPAGIDENGTDKPEAEKEERPEAAPEKRLHARLSLGVRDHGLAEKHAAALSRRGFNVVKAAARGVSFEGTHELFESTFDCKVEAEESPCFEDEPKLPQALEESVDSVYFPTRPTFYGKERKR